MRRRDVFDSHHVRFLALFLMGLATCSGAFAEPLLRRTFTHEAMGTEFSLTLYSRPEDKGTDEIRGIADEAFAVVDDLENKISVWRLDSQVAYINKHAAREPTKAAPDVIDLILYCRKVYSQTDGAFDVTVGPLVKLWGFYRSQDESSPQGPFPSDEALAETCAKVGMDKVAVDLDKGAVSFARDGMLLDFGGIGKGLALDRAAEVLKRHGVTTAALSAGTSSIVVLGTPPAAAGWRVRVRDPYDDRASLDEVILRDEALSTSGSYEKFFELGGKKYGHIFDPRTGRPVEGMLSVTVIGRSGMETDALSTAFFVMGAEKTRAYCKTHPGLRVTLVPAGEKGNLHPVRVGDWDQDGKEPPPLESSRHPDAKPARDDDAQPFLLPVTVRVNPISQRPCPGRPEGSARP